MGAAEVDVEATGEFVRPDWASRAEAEPAPGFIQVLNQRYATQQHTRVRTAEVTPAESDQQFARTRLRTEIGASKLTAAAQRIDVTMPVGCRASEHRPHEASPSVASTGVRQVDVPKADAQQHGQGMKDEPIFPFKSLASAAEVPQAVPAPQLETAAKSGGVPKSPWIMAAVAAAIVGLAVWWVMFQRLPDIDPRQLITANLAAAKNALDAGRVIDPPERSALHYYGTVLALDPANMAAQGAIEKIANGFIDEAKANLVAGNLAATVSALQSARRVQPDDPRLPAMDAQLREQLEQQMQQSREAQAAAEQQMAAQDKPAETRATARAAPTQRDPRELVAKALANATQAIEHGQLDVARILIDDAKDLGVTAPDLATLDAALARAEEGRTKSDLLQLVLQRSAENQLLEPAQDSAKHYLDQLAQADATFPGLKQGIEALGGRLVATAQVATYGKDFDLAAGLLSQARAIGFSGVEVDAAEAALSAARKPAASPAAVSLEPKLIKFVQPEYPKEGRIRGAEGWVDLTLAVTASGDVADSSIQNSNLSPSFGRAALAASRQWKYEPRVLANATQPVQVRVTFRLDDDKAHQRLGGIRLQPTPPLPPAGEGREVRADALSMNPR